MRPIPFLCGVLLVACGYLPGVQAQNAGADSLQEPPLLMQVRALDLDSLQRGRTTVHFTPSYRERAERLGPQINRALQLFSDSLGIKVQAFHLILADSSDWRQLAAGQRPYGLHVWLGGWWSRNMGPEQAEGLSSHPPTAIVPADAGGLVFNHYQAHEDCLAPKHRKRLKQLGLSWEEAIRQFVEMITFHEVGHAVLAASEIETPLWFNEFLAGYFSYAHLFYNEPARAPLWDLMSTVNLTCYTPDRRTLKQFALGNTGGADYAWYQSNFEQRANRVVENHGFEFIRKAREVFSAADPDPLMEKVHALEKHWDSLSAEEKRQQVEKIHEEMLERLERIAPGFEEWARQFEHKEGEEG